MKKPIDKLIIASLLRRHVQIITSELSEAHDLSSLHVTCIVHDLDGFVLMPHTNDDLVTLAFLEDVSKSIRERLLLADNNNDDELKH